MANATLCAGRVCPTHSICFSSRCICEPLYTGPACNTSYVDAIGQGTVIGFSVGVAFLNAVVLALAAYILHRRCRRIELMWKFNEPVGAMVLVIVAAACRVLQFGVRPQDMGAWFHPAIFEVVNSLPVLAVAAAYVVVMVFLIRAHSAASRKREPDVVVQACWSSARTAVPVLSCGFALFATVTLATNVLMVLAIRSHSMLWIREISFFAFVSSAMLAFGYVGTRLYRRSTGRFSRRRLALFMSGAVLPAATCAGVSLLVGLLDAPRTPRLWVLLTALLRLSEAVLCYVLLLTFRPPSRLRHISTDAVRYALSSHEPLNVNTTLLNFAQPAQQTI